MPVPYDRSGPFGETMSVNGIIVPAPLDSEKEATKERVPVSSSLFCSEPAASRNVGDPTEGVASSASQGVGACFNLDA